jgi:major membrane immunogen (membrane-anchored lipoprotein)
MKRISLILLSVGALTACGEATQTLGTKNDATAYSGATNSYVEAGWTAGNKTSWEQHLRTRAQYGQDDHSRAPK